MTGIPEVLCAEALALWEANHQHPNDEGAKAKLEQAKGLFKLAAEKGNTEAQARLGMWYLRENNLQEAMPLFEKAAAGSGEWAKRACVSLGAIFESGDAGEKDLAKALHYYRHGQTLGDEHAPGRIRYVENLIAKEAKKEAK
jgi:TPR repeat protein